MSEKVNESETMHEEKNAEDGTPVSEPQANETGTKEEVNLGEVEQLKINLEKAEAEKKEFQDRLLRKVAEFDNYKRRTENEFSNLFKYAAENFIKKILPVVDDFERSLAHANDAENSDSLASGIKLIYDKLVKILDEQGVKKIESVGKPFDVHFHEALLQRKDETQPPHSVLDEVETGYLYQDKVIRHAKVIVNEDFHVE